MRMTWKTAVVAAAALGVAADAALAWGPATHIGLGESVLGQIALLPAAIGALLSRHALAYLYGNIAADVVFAKRLSRVKQFCHHWTTGFRLLETARHDRSRAFAYGYLSHLAADTIAHGKYVPRQLAVSECSQNFGHFYWELRADSTQGDGTWRRLEDVASPSHLEHHESLREQLRDTFLSYPMNRWLFEGMNALAARRGFRRTMVAWGRRSRWPLPASLLEGYQGESVDRIISVLSEGRRSAVVREDPNGTSALMQVRVIRVEVRRMKRRGYSVDRRLREASSALAPAERSNQRSVGVVEHLAGG